MGIKYILHIIWCVNRSKCNRNFGIFFAKKKEKLKMLVKSTGTKRNRSGITRHLDCLPRLIPVGTALVASAESRRCSGGVVDSRSASTPRTKRIQGGIQPLPQISPRAEMRRFAAALPPEPHGHIAEPAQTSHRQSSRAAGAHWRSARVLPPFGRGGGSRKPSFFSTCDL